MPHTSMTYRYEPARPVDGLPAVLRVEGLSKRFGEQHAVIDASFDVRAREILGIIGPNGAGKTTLMECVAGLLPADTGQVLWDGFPFYESDRKRIISYVPDLPYPFSDQTVLSVLKTFQEAYGRDVEALRWVTQSLELDRVLVKTVAQLSKGYRRRLLLGIGLLTRQRILMIDEPFDGLDLIQVRSVSKVLRAATETDRTLVLSIHQLSDAERICDRFVLLAGGRVKGVGTFDELRQKSGLSSSSTLEDIFVAMS